MLNSMSDKRRSTFPQGTSALCALHDVGKISTGFQSKCLAWLEQHQLLDTAQRERWREGSESDHAKVSQYFLQCVLKPSQTALWAVAAGVHHGRIFGRRISSGQFKRIAGREDCEDQARENLLAEITAIFGNLPTLPPRIDRSDLWCVAGLIAVADWIGSNEAFFPPDRDLTLEQSRSRAEDALRNICWHGGGMLARDFGALFQGYAPMPLQRELHSKCVSPGLFIVEGPMGCGKTEAALWAAHRLIASGANEGLYFALPTQVTSNRIHQRVAPFLRAALADPGNLRLAHAASWLEDHQTWRLLPANSADPEAAAHVQEGRSWFASSKHAMLARYGVGTVDQALQGVVAVKHFFVRRFGLAGKVVVLDEIHSYDVYTGTLITQLIRELLALDCTVIVLSATLTGERRKELISAADGRLDQTLSTAYPLLTVARAGTRPVEISVESPAHRELKLLTTSMTEDEILEECVKRAESGQHVLYLRNTVAEAQESCRKARGSVRDDKALVATLHSRFPFFRRQELETEWLGRLGKTRPMDAKGSLLVATQVVEQSVDIDLDFIVTDLAPTDMLLQRMGRLWRHQRPSRVVAEPEFWINAPCLDPDASADSLARAFGKSGMVYAPYVLLRTAEVFTKRTRILLPHQIREVLEMTYAERTAQDEPDSWRALHHKVVSERENLAKEAEAATRVLDRQSIDDKREYLTRRRGAPTRDVVLLKSCEPIARDRSRLITLDGTTVEADNHRWSMDAARAVHRNLVRAPLHTVPDQEMPSWLKLHTNDHTYWALVKTDGSLHFPNTAGSSFLAYHAVLGLTTHPGQKLTRHTDDDDEFDH